MPALKRQATKYPGIFWIVGSSPIDGTPDRIYYIRYRRDGKMIEEKAGRSSINDMTPARAARMRAERMAGKALPNQERREKEKAERRAQDCRPTLARLWDEFYRQKQDNKSIRDDLYRWRGYLEKAFGEKEPCELVTLDVDRLRHRLGKRGLAPATVKQALMLLKRIINFAVRKGLCPAPDPSRLHFEMPRVSNEVTEDLTPDQLQALLAAIDADHDWRAAGVMRLALFTGMRRGELLKLCWQDVDFGRGFITLRDPKGGRNQTIPLNPAARSVFEGLPRTDSPQVFPGRDGKPLSDLKRPLARIKARAGLPPGFRPLHGLRHVYASAMASSGQVDMYTLQKLLTHKSPQMTQRYAHLRDEAMQRAAEVAGDIFQPLGQGGQSTGQDKGKGRGKVVNMPGGE